MPPVLSIAQWIDLFKTVYTYLLRTERLIKSSYEFLKIVAGDDVFGSSSKTLESKNEDPSQTCTLEISDFPFDVEIASH